MAVHHGDTHKRAFASFAEIKDSFQENQITINENILRGDLFAESFSEEYDVRLAFWTFRGKRENVLLLKMPAILPECIKHER